jgi:hypothetical protein
VPLLPVCVGSGGSVSKQALSNHNKNTYSTSRHATLLLLAKTLQRCCCCSGCSTALRSYPTCPAASILDSLNRIGYTSTAVQCNAQPNRPTYLPRVPIARTVHFSHLVPQTSLSAFPCSVLYARPFALSIAILHSRLQYSFNCLFLCPLSFTSDGTEQPVGPQHTPEGLFACGVPRSPSCRLHPSFHDIPSAESSLDASLHIRPLLHFGIGRRSSKSEVGNPTRACIALSTSSSLSASLSAYSTLYHFFHLLLYTLRVSYMSTLVLTDQPQPNGANDLGVTSHPPVKASPTDRNPLFETSMHQVCVYIHFATITTCAS